MIEEARNIVDVDSKREGPNTDPRGTPDAMSRMCELVLLKVTEKWRFDIQEAMVFVILVGKIRACSLCIKAGCQILSKAFDKYSEKITFQS